MLSAFGRLIKGSAIYGIGQFLPALVGFLLIPVYTRYLTTTDYGIVGIATSVTSIFAIMVGMGLRGSVTRHYFDYPAESPEWKRHLGSVVVLFLLVGICATLLLHFFGRPLFDGILTAVAFHPYIELALWIGLLMAAWELLMALLIARQQPVRYVSLQIGKFLLSLTLILVFVVGYRQGALGKLKGSLFAELSFFVVFVLMIARAISLKLSWEKIRSSLRFGLPLVPHLIFSWVLLSSDRIILESLTSLSHVGVYNLGYQIGFIMGMFVAAINLAWNPFFYKTAENQNSAPELIAQAARWYVVVVSLVAVGLILFSREIILIMADHTYHGAIIVVPAVVIGHLFQGLHCLSAASIFYRKKTGWLPLLTGVAAAINIALNFLWIPRLGILGAAYATTVSFAIQFAGSYVLGQRLYRIPYPVGRILTVLSLLTGVFFANHFLACGEVLQSVLIKAGLLMAFVFGLFLSRVVRIEELKKIRSLFGQNGSG